MSSMHFLRQLTTWRHHQPKPDVALVLGGGGARGLAQLGVIRVLQEHGYRLTSVAGTSIGALVGGFFVACQLDEMERRVNALTHKQLVQLLSFKPGWESVATARQLKKLLDKLLCNIRIEQLAVPYCCVASDVISGRRYVFTEGKLSTAIRASISIPCFFDPVNYKGMLLVDGSVHDTLPLDLARRSRHTIVVAVDASATNQNPIAKAPQNYLSMTVRCSEMIVSANTELMKQLYHPDVLINLPTDHYGMFDFDKGADIIAYGRVLAEKAIAAYERK